MNKKLKLKKFVMPTIYVALVSVLVVSALMSMKTFKPVDEEIEQIDYVSNDVLDEEMPVISTDKTIIRPYTASDVKVGKYYYDYKDNSEEQKKGNYLLWR